MRFVLGLFGLLASSLTAGLGVAFLMWNDVLPEVLSNTPADVLNAVGLNENSTRSLTSITYGNAALVTLAAGGYGILGSLLTMFRCGKQGGALLLVPVLGAAFMNPISLLVTWFQALVALACFFIGPLPIEPPAEKDADEDEEEEEEKPKPKPKMKPKPKKIADDD